MISLVSGSTRVLVDEEAGGRVASLEIRGVERMLTREHTDGDSLAWGAYPMVPWAGRVRDGRFMFGHHSYALPLRLPPHAIHGTVFERPWTIESTPAPTTTAVSLRTDLGPDWPWPGHVTHDVALVRAGLRCRLAVHAHDEAFPAQVGWHPWFSDGGRPPALVFSAQAMYRRDRAGLPDGSMVVPGPHPWDDCFVGVADSPVLRYRDGVELVLSSDCDHWVVFEPGPAVCVEPQSGPPDGFSLAPRVVHPGQPLSRTFELLWTSADRRPSGHGVRMRES